YLPYVALINYHYVLSDNSFWDRFLDVAKHCVRQVDAFMEDAIYPVIRFIFYRPKRRGLVGIAKPAP
ncbi:hypothetical protein AAAA28_21275, partial [Providencia stuartii]|uniref:hypothetical protein n=1 Tax=Providencia stuartii TaxID=588 RepID=UPI0030F1C1B1